MLAELQTVILTCLLGPEDPTAWAREGSRRLRLRTPGYDAKWRASNPDSVRDTNRKQYLLDPQKYCRQSHDYRKKNKEKVRLFEKEKKARNRKDPKWRLVASLRIRLRDALKGRGVKKSQATMGLLGCPVVWLEAHLESLFRPGMTWGNRGLIWHIDHKKPCAKFDLVDPEQQRICFHWTNLQPLFATENLKKGDTYAC